jgi:hypothetical protein
MKENTYNSTKPNNLFVGREELLEELINGFRNGNSFAVLGGRRCGKTSLLLELESLLQKRETLRPFRHPYLLQALFERIDLETALNITVLDRAVRKFPYFLASDFIQGNELPVLLKAAESDGLKVCWVLISTCLYKTSALADFQAAHDTSRPLAGLKGDALNRALTEICGKISDLFREC